MKPSKEEIIQALSRVEIQETRQTLVEHQADAILKLFEDKTSKWPMKLTCPCGNVIKFEMYMNNMGCSFDRPSKPEWEERFEQVCEIWDSKDLSVNLYRVNVSVGKLKDFIRSEMKAILKELTTERPTYLIKCIDIERVFEKRGIE